MAHRFIIDDQTGQLYKDFTGRRLTSAAEVLKAERGLAPTFEIYLINVASDTGVVTGQTLTNAQLSVAIGAASKPPETGLIKASWSVSGSLYESEQLKLENLTASAIESAFNASVYPVYIAGGLTVDEIGIGKYLLTMKKVGAIDGAPSINLENVDPPSGVEVTSIRTGDSDTKAQWIISISQLPVASIAGGSFSSVNQGSSFNGLSASIALNTTGMIAAVTRGQQDFEFSIVHNNQLLHRSQVKINESLDPTAAGTVIVTSPNIFTLASNGVSQGETIALSGGLTYDGTTLNAPLSNYLPLAGGTLTGALNFGDNINAQFGDSQQLKIYHNGANNAFIENSTTYLVLESSAIILRNTAGNEDYAKFLGDGGCEFYFNNSKKLETTSLGATISGKLIVNGDMDVSGTTTTFNSTVVTVDDPVFTVGGDTAPGSDDNKDRGIEFRYYSGSAKVGFFGYDDSEDAFTFLTDATNNSEVFDGTLGNLKVKTVYFADGTEASPSVRFNVDSDTGIFRPTANTLAFTTGGAEAARFDSSGHFLISDDNKIKLGASGDVEINHDGNAKIVNSTGYTRLAATNGVLYLDGNSTHIRSGDGGETQAKFIDNGAVELYHDGTKRLDTTSSGININGGITFDSTFTEIIRSSNSLRINIDNDGNQTDRIFIVSANSGMDELFRVQEDGKVGIGGTPNELLQIDGTSPKIRLRDTDASGTPYVQIDASDGNILLSADAGNEIASSNIQFAVDGTEAARFNSSGQFTTANNVGIGNVTSPLYPLVVNSAGDGIKLDITDGVDANFRVTVNGAVTEIGPSTATAAFMAGGAERMRLNSTGLGIGTTSPSAKLEIAGNTDEDSNFLIIRDKDPSSGSARPSVRFAKEDGTILGQLLALDGANQRLQFSGNNTEDNHLTVYNNGNVGIGTTSPVSPLTVESNLNALADADEPENYHLLLRNPANDTNEGVGMGFLVSGATSDVGASIICKRTGNNAQSELQFWNKQNVTVDGVVSQAMTIASSGNVGIGGVTSPSRTLSVNSGSSNIAASFESTDTGAYISFLDDSSLNDASVRLGALGNDFQLFTNGQERFRAKSTGEIGIGTTAPQANLHIFKTEGGVGAKHATIRLGGYSTTGAEISAYRFDGNSNNQGLIFSSHDATDGIVERMRIASDGDITQNYINYTDASNYEALKISAESDHIKFNTSSIGSFASNNRSIKFNVGDTERLEVNNVGAKVNGNFEITEASTSGGAVMRLTSTAETSADNVIGEIEFYNSDTTDFTPGVMSSIRAIGGPSGGEGHLQFLTDMPSEGADAATVALHLHSNAHVGIGTTLPNALLHVKKTGGNGEIELERDSGALINLQAQSARGVIGTDSNHELQIKTNATAQMSISTSGDAELLTDGKGLILSSPDGTRYKITVANGGAVTSTAM